MENSWIEESVWSDPSSIEIKSEEGASVVSILHSVWIEHWNDFEDKVLSKRFSL